MSVEATLVTFLEQHGGLLGPLSVIIYEHQGGQLGPTSGSSMRYIWAWCRKRLQKCKNFKFLSFQMADKYVFENEDSDDQKAKEE